MIPKSERLTRSEVDALFDKRAQAEAGAKKRAVLHTPSLFVVLERSETFKAGVAAPKAVFKRAVDRNRARRTLYDGLRALGFSSLPFHILISVKKGVKELSKETLKKELEELQRKIKAL